MKGTKIKICGLFRPEDIDCVNVARPDYAGFILSPGFRRSITEEQVTQFRYKLDEKIIPVGVFVNAPPEEIISYLKRGIIRMAQLHGEETESDIRHIQDAAGRPVSKAVKVRSRADAEAWTDSAADYLVFDGGTGTGRVFDWSLLHGIEREFFLAGGLNVSNLPEALGRLHPYAVDLSSGVETDGVKDREKIRAVTELVRKISFTERRRT